MNMMIEQMNLHREISQEDHGGVVGATGEVQVEDTGATDLEGGEEDKGGFSIMYILAVDLKMKLMVMVMKMLIWMIMNQRNPIGDSK